ncbi:MAG TPA: YqgE/AlgH family protein [Acidimicrobiia bacterium]|nr:YqgE/AlgH family protein [Acidimicrobiia bacterium]
MAESMRGSLVVATPDLLDPNFARTVVLILEHSPEGAVGVVLNRPSATVLEEGMPGWAMLAAPPSRVFVGGPVEPVAAIGLGRVPSGRSSSPEGRHAALFGEVCSIDLGSDPVLSVPDVEVVRVFAGYAGWGPGQLDDEVAADGWFVVDRDDGDVFSGAPEVLWREVLRRQPGPLRLFSTYPEDPSQN